MRKCTKCNVTKPEEDFYWSNKEHTQRERRCKSCCVAARAGYDKKNADKVKEVKARVKKRNKGFIIQHLLNNPCVDCGESDIQVLQFDHTEPLLGNRKRRVTAHINYSLERLREEINKCEIRCANCHMRRTREQFGWTLTL